MLSSVNSVFEEVYRAFVAQMTLRVEGSVMQTLAQGWRLTCEAGSSTDYHLRGMPSSKYNYNKMPQRYSVVTRIDAAYTRYIQLVLIRRLECHCHCGWTIPRPSRDCHVL